MTFLTFLIKKNEKYFIILFFCIHSPIDGLLITNMNQCQVEDESQEYTSYEVARFYGDTSVNTAGIRLPTDVIKHIFTFQTRYKVVCERLFDLQHILKIQPIFHWRNNSCVILNLRNNHAYVLKYNIQNRVFKEQHKRFLTISLWQRPEN